MTKEIWTVKRIIEWGKNYLQEKQIDSPRLTMELLLCEVMNLRRIDLYLHHDKPLNNDELKLLEKQTYELLGEDIYIEKKLIDEYIQFLYQ